MLNDRKRKILQIIIEDYIETARNRWVHEPLPANIIWD